LNLGEKGYYERNFSSVYYFGFAQEEQQPEGSDFVAQLEANEEQEYQEIVTQIQTMSNEEYSVFLNRRLEDAYTNKQGPIRTYIVVDVTDEMNQPEPGFFQKLVSSVPDSKEYGANKVRSVLDAVSKQKAKTQTMKMTMKDHYRSQNRVRHFQRIEGMLDESSAKLLVGQGGIVDIYVVDENKAGSEFIATHTPTGRIIPSRSQKLYSDDFLIDGFYNELMDKFIEREVLTVQVSFKKPEGYEYTRSWHDKMVADVEQYIESWDEYDFEVVFKNHSHVIIKTTKEHVQSLRDDDQITFIKHKSSPVELF